jgi:cell division protein FtsI/penicillin-binding protein 2
VSDHDIDSVNDVLDFLNAYPGKPLLANTYQERYMPGSSFKVITTGIALENGVTDARPALGRARASGCHRRPPTRSRTTAAARAAAR